MQAHVKLSGDINGRYVVTDRRAGGELTLVPDTSAEAIPRDSQRPSVYQLAHQRLHGEPPRR
ncbi:MAG: hypothetical protein ABSH36_16780 [Solirubrobacteraceae bacterium]